MARGRDRAARPAHRDRLEKPLSGTLIDTHCHVDAYPDPASILAAAASAGVEVIAVTNSPDAYNRLATLLPRSGPARPALGLHPLHAGQLGMAGVLRFSRMAAQSRVDRRDRPRLLTRRPRQPPRAAQPSSKRCSRSLSFATAR